MYYKACPSGLYGIGCSLHCLCANGGHCDPVSGTCQCAEGWRGDLCETECNAGWYGANCALQCDCVHAEGCDRVSGNCTCSPGYQGIRCDQSK